MKVLDLCSGIGGFTLAHEMVGGFETVAFCEQDEFCQRVLRKHWPDVPIFDDIKTLRGDEIGTADVICGGIPCQPFSVAGQRKGTDDDRHLWPHFLRIVRELRPAYVLVENVTGFISLALDRVLSDLESEGYAAQAFVVPACAVNAPHRRDRVWILAYCHESRSQERQGQPGDNGAQQSPAERGGVGASASALADAESQQTRPSGQSRECGYVEHSEGFGRRKGRTESEVRGGRSAIAKPSGTGDVGHAPSVRRNGHSEIGGGSNQGLKKGRVLQSSGASTMEHANESDRWSGQFSGFGGDPWADSEWLQCADGKARRVPFAGFRMLDAGIPERTHQIKALGNAIVPQVAARFFYAMANS